jgi:hypothetical protein
MDLEAAGLLTAATSLAWLLRTQSPRRAAEAIAAAAEGREAVLAKSVSDAGWARLLRAALGADPSSNDSGLGYRDGATRAAPVVARTFDAESARLRRGRAGGGGGAAGPLATAARSALAPGLAWVGALVALAAVPMAWAIASSARRSRAAIANVHEALPDLARRLEPPPPPRRVDGATLPIRLPSRAALGALPLAGASFALLRLASETTKLLDARHVYADLFASVAFVALLAAAALLFSRMSIDVDAERAELVLTRSVLGLSLSATRVPLEIVRGASTRPTRWTTLIRSTQLLVLELTAVAAEIRLYEGYGATRAADDLNRALTH